MVGIPFGARLLFRGELLNFQGVQKTTVFCSGLPSDTLDGSEIPNHHLLNPLGRKQLPVNHGTFTSNLSTGAVNLDFGTINSTTVSPEATYRNHVDSQGGVLHPPGKPPKTQAS